MKLKLLIGCSGMFCSGTKMEGAGDLSKPVRQAPIQPGFLTYTVQLVRFGLPGRTENPGGFGPGGPASLSVFR